jgi:hypothetical protein
MAGNVEDPHPIGIIFNQSALDPNELREQKPHFLSYKIRTFEKKIQNTKEIFPYFTMNEEHDGESSRTYLIPTIQLKKNCWEVISLISPFLMLVSPYIYTGFSGVQSAIDHNFIKILNKRLTEIGSVYINSLGTTVWS